MNMVYWPLIRKVKSQLPCMTNHVLQIKYILFVGLLYEPPLRMDYAENMFVDVSCGKEHYMALTKDGSVYTWGCGR